MPKAWRVKIRRANGQNCYHMAGEVCPFCEEDRASAFRDPGSPVRSPRAFSFHLAAADLADRVFAPGETPHDISSRRELLEFCEARGLRSKYLKDSMVFPDRKPREV